MTQTLQSRIHPALRYKDAHRAVDWLARAFGFEKRAVHEGPDGSIAHAEMTFGSSVVGFSSIAAVDPDNPWTMVRQGIYVALNDVDAHHERAVAAGAEIVRALRDESYGSRDYSARDHEGHLWDFGTYRMIQDDNEQAFSVGLQYKDAAIALDWLERAFGFRKTFEVRGDDGAIFHAEMRCGADALMIDAGSPDERTFGGLSQYSERARRRPRCASRARPRRRRHDCEVPRDQTLGARLLCARLRGISVELQYLQTGEIRRNANRRQRDQENLLGRKRVSLDLMTSC